MAHELFGVAPDSSARATRPRVAVPLVLIVLVGLVFFFSVIVLIVFGKDTRGSVHPGSLEVGLTVIVLIVLCGYYLVRAHRHAKHGETQNLATAWAARGFDRTGAGRRTITIDRDAGVTLDRGLESRTVRWPMIDEIRRNAAGLVIISTRREVIAIVPRGSDTDAERRRFEEAALAYYLLARGTDEEQITQFLQNNAAACPKCRYALRGNTTAMCPECGLRLNAANFWPAFPHRMSAPNSTPWGW